MVERKQAEPAFEIIQTSEARQCNPTLFVKMPARTMAALGLAYADKYGNITALPPDKVMERLNMIPDRLRAAEQMLQENVTAIKTIESLLERVRENLRLYGRVRGLGGGL